MEQFRGSACLDCSCISALMWLDLIGEENFHFLVRASNSPLIFLLESEEFGLQRVVFGKHRIGLPLAQVK